MSVSLVVYLLVRMLLTGSHDEEILRKDTKHQRFPLLTSAGIVIINLLFFLYSPIITIINIGLSDLILHC